MASCGLVCVGFAGVRSLIVLCIVIIVFCLYGGFWLFIVLNVVVYCLAYSGW